LILYSLIKMVNVPKACTNVPGMVNNSSFKYAFKIIMKVSKRLKHIVP